MLKTLQARLQQFMNQDLPDVHAVFRNRGGAIKLPIFLGSRSMQWSSIYIYIYIYTNIYIYIYTNIYIYIDIYIYIYNSDSFTMLKTLTVWIRTN